MSPADVAAVRDRLAAESAARAALITGDAPDEAEVAARRDRALGELGVSAVAFQARGEVCAPVISQEMTDWVALGGGNSGCVGNAAHTYGFHRGANYIPADDYSRRRDPNGSDGPYTSWDYACAGDYYHGGKAALRARHAQLLDRLMSGDPALSAVCEMITMPWADKPVMYWARWEGVGNLRRYTGVGHDVWSRTCATTWSPPPAPARTGRRRRGPRRRSWRRWTPRSRGSPPGTRPPSRRSRRPPNGSLPRSGRSTR
jgi:hypothetical protein